MEFHRFAFLRFSILLPCCLLCLLLSLLITFQIVSSLFVVTILCEIMVYVSSSTNQYHRLKRVFHFYAELHECTIRFNILFFCESVKRNYVLIFLFVISHNMNFRSGDFKMR